ncbi:cobyrinate a,c-diamide synthase [Peptoniphilus sp. EMRHCC_23]|uniref:cobyrinate a,c-diamide synthase n=1 Tax=Peptoniphilus rachelemmaiella TaxID=2811779 RepID=UPI001C00071C|nr:cobyrinate a,c-diamide synthase [Peptoniphilus rachelemmaiella]
MKRLLLSAGHSGAGKTSITMGIIGALIRRNMTVASAKIGPDYIDPMYHRALGAYGVNLDRHLMDDEYILHLMARLEKKDVIVMEGAMGYYDGMATTTTCSAAEMANFTKTPTIFIASGRGKGASLGAELQGFLNYGKNTISGVILNHTKPAMASYYEKIIKEATDLPLFGCIPDLDQDLPERYLGLERPEEIKNFRAFADQWADVVENYVDLDKLLAACETKSVGREMARTPQREKIPVAIAKDEAFFFYYQDVLDDLSGRGVEWIPFSPLTDSLPKGICGAYLGGGYPELYEEILVKNKALGRDLKSFAEKGGVLIAEGGGFMSLLEKIDGSTAFGLFPGEAIMTDRLQHFGYQVIAAEEDGLLLKAGESSPVHEFHYSAADNEGGDLLIQKPGGRAKRRTAHHEKNVYAGYPELHISGNEKLRENILKALKEATPWQG